MNIKINWSKFEWITIFLFYLLMIFSDIKLLEYEKRIIEMNGYYLAIVIMVLFLLIPKKENLKKHILNKNTLLKILIVTFSYVMYLTVAMALVMFITQESI